MLTAYTVVTCQGINGRFVCPREPLFCNARIPWQGLGKLQDSGSLRDDMRFSRRRIKISPLTRIIVFARDEHACVYCGWNEDDSKLQIDHVHPVSKGGSDHIENLVTCCPRCQYLKFSKTLDEWDAECHKMYGMSLTQVLLGRIRKREAEKYKKEKSAKKKDRNV